MESQNIEYPHEELAAYDQHYCWRCFISVIRGRIFGCDEKERLFGNWAGALMRYATNGNENLYNENVDGEENS